MPAPVWSDQVSDRILNELAKERGGGYVHQQLVNMDQPVTVRCEGQKVFEGKVQPALSAMVESIEDKLDSRMWYWGRIGF